VEVAVARARLEETLAELDRSAAALQAEGTGESGEVAAHDAHASEAATDMQDADRQVAVLDVVIGQRAEVVAALRRIEAGRYGRCVDCAAELPEARLDARPEAARCVSCQHKVEQR